MIKSGSKLRLAFLSAVGLSSLISSASASPVQFGGSYYEFVNTGSFINWSDAASAASLRTHAGATGYLANVTSQSENDFLLSLTSSFGFNGFVGSWLGIVVNNDLSSQWAFGPEAGDVFSNYQTPTPGHYANWGGVEPNAPDSNKGYMHIGANFSYVDPGKWLDAGQGLAGGADPVVGYFVEYTPAATSAVPVPAAFPLLMAALGGLGLIGWRGNARKAA